MPVVGYPGEHAPAIPAVRVTLPDDWRAVPGGAALFTVTAPQRDDGTTPTVSAHLLTLAQTLSVSGYAEHLASQASARPGGQADPPFEVELAGRVWTGLNTSFASGTTPVVEVHLLTGLDTGSALRIVRLTGTVGGPHADTDYDVVQGILESAEVDERSSS